MNCNIPAMAVKHFTRAIICLAKIGESINFEITPSRFILRTLGEAEAAYFQIDFCTKPGVFFETYDCYYLREASTDTVSNNDKNKLPANENESFTTSSTETNRTIKARIKSRIFLSTFRLCDSAQSVALRFHAELNKLDIISTFSYNITRKYTIRFEDIPTILQAEFSSNSSNLRELSCPSHTFKRMLYNFANSLQEITLIASAKGLAIKSFIDDIGSTDSISTECHINQSEFTSFALHLTSNLRHIILTVVQKEFKAFLTLCEALEEPIQIFLTFGGSPILLTNQTPHNLRGFAHNAYVSGKGIGIKLIMATIADESQEIAVLQQPKQPQSTASSTGTESTHVVRRPKQRNDDLLAQQQSTASIASRSNHNNNNELLSAHVDDNDVIMDMPTHGQFAVDEHSQFLPNDTVQTTQQVTVIPDTEIQDNESVSRSVSRTRSADYRLLQPHPDSITPHKHKQMLGNKENEGDFHVNIPETESFNMRKQKRYTDERRKIVPSSSESERVKRVENVINLVDEEQDMNASLDLQYFSDENNAKRNHNKGRDGLSSYLDHVDKGRYSMTQTQPANGGQIANRLERERSRMEERSNGNDGSERKRKRRMEQNHYDDDNAAKRQRYNNNKKNTSYTSSLRRKPKSNWQPSPDRD